MPSAEEVFVLQPMNQQELDDILNKHELFLNRKPGGARAIIRDREMGQLNFSKRNISQADFAGCIMRHGNFSFCNFESATIFSCDLSESKMVSVKFIRADLRGSAFENCDLQNSDFSQADLREGAVIKRKKSKKPNDTFNKATKAGTVIFRGSNLTNCNFSQAVAINADFTDALMTNCNLQKANFKTSVFDFCDLTGSSFNFADLRDVSFKGAHMINTQMQSVEKQGADFTLTLMNEVKGQEFDEVEMSLDELVLRHTHWLATGGREGKQLDISNTDMRKAGILGGKKLTALKAINATFAEMNLNGIELQSAILDGSDFRKATFMRADLRGASFKNAIFNHAILTYADLTPLTIKRADGSEIMRPVHFEGGYFHHADFSNARLRSAQFQAADLAYAQFVNCDLREANFKGANLEKTIFTDSILDGALFDSVFQET
jgi:uncharacterized protein YjbI with pentapeptide repeats